MSHLPLFPVFFFSFIFSQLVCLSTLSSPTAIGIFFLLLDARVRGTGDVVNSLKSEGGWEMGGGWWCLTWHDDLSCFQWWRHQSCFKSPHRIRADSDSPKPKRMNESVLLLLSRFKPAPAGWPHRRVSVKRSLARLFSLCDIAVLVRRGLASLNVLLVDEHLDALLDHADTWVEPGFGLIDDLHRDKWKTVHLLLQTCIYFEYCYLNNNHFP